MQTLPKARRSDLVVTELGNELLVYDLKTDRAISLDPAAAAIWNNCDGNTTTERLGLKIGLQKDLVEIAIGDLSENRLIESGALPKASQLTRRKVLAGAAAALAAIPVILAVSAPTAAQAGSCVGNGQVTSVKNSPSGGGLVGCLNTAASQCCSKTSFNGQGTQNGDGTWNCSATCGNIIAAPSGGGGPQGR